MAKRHCGVSAACCARCTRQLGLLGSACGVRCCLQIETLSPGLHSQTLAKRHWCTLCASDTPTCVWANTRQIDWRTSTSTRHVDHHAWKTPGVNFELAHFWRNMTLTDQRFGFVIKTHAARVPTSRRCRAGSEARRRNRARQVTDGDDKATKQGRGAPASCRTCVYRPT